MTKTQCAKCKSEQEIGTNFCTDCGAKIMSVAKSMQSDVHRLVHDGLPENGIVIEKPKPISDHRSGIVKYDPHIIQSYADALYALADRIIWTQTAVGALIGGVVGYGIGNYAGGGGLVALLGAAFGGYVGYNRGQAKTFSLRLEAQLALCQVEIEHSTRHLRN
jgi:hypothetical protein